MWAAGAVAALLSIVPLGSQRSLDGRSAAARAYPAVEACLTGVPANVFVLDADQKIEIAGAVIKLLPLQLVPIVTDALRAIAPRFKDDVVSLDGRFPKIPLSASGKAANWYQIFRPLPLPLPLRQSVERQRWLYSRLKYASLVALGVNLSVERTEGPIKLGVHGLEYGRRSAVVDQIEGNIRFKEWTALTNSTRPHIIIGSPEFDKYPSAVLRSQGTGSVKLGELTLLIRGRSQAFIKELILCDVCRAPGFYRRPERGADSKQDRQHFDRRPAKKSIRDRGGILSGRSTSPLGFEIGGLVSALFAYAGLLLLPFSSFSLLRGLGSRSFREGRWWIVAAFGGLIGGFACLFVFA